MRSFSILLLLMSFYDLPGQQHIIEITDPYQMSLEGERTGILFDSFGLSFEETQLQSFRLGTNAYFNFDPTHDYIWLKISAKNLTKDDAIVRVGNGVMSSISFYLLSGDSLVKESHSGCSLDFDSREIL